jgi:hypothetical protein
VTGAQLAPRRAVDPGELLDAPLHFAPLHRAPR